MSEEPRLVRVRICHGVDLAQIYKAKLEAMGIPVLLKYESIGPVYGITVDGLGEVQILVPEAYAEEAKNLLEDVDVPLDEALPDEGAEEGEQEMGG